MLKFTMALIMTISSLPLLAQEYYLVTGTYTTGSSKGIYVYRFNATTGKVTPADTVEGIKQPSYLTISADGDFVYAVSETGGENPGSIHAYSFDRKNGKLTFLNQRPSAGDAPCYITVSSNRKWVIAGNYSGGNLVAYALERDGSLSENRQVINHSGKGADASRQDAPHVHSTLLTPDGQYLLVPDLGIDKVMIYRFNEKAKKNPLSPAAQPYAATRPGAGPRHLSFHPNGKWVYLMEELSGFVSAWQYNKGRLQLIDSIDAHPPGYNGSRGSADIHVSPDGRHLYASNRFEANNLAIFRIEEGTGKLSASGFQDVIGSKPRNFIIEPSGKFVLVANQETNDIRIFRRDAETGALTPTGEVIHVGNPVCLKLVAVQ